MKATLTMYNSIVAFLTPHNTRGGLIAALIGLHCSPRKSAQPPATINLPGERAFPEILPRRPTGRSLWAAWVPPGFTVRNATRLNRSNRYGPGRLATDPSSGPFIEPIAATLIHATQAGMEISGRPTRGSRSSIRRQALSPIIRWRSFVEPECSRPRAAPEGKYFRWSRPRDR
jgi:hypothetical protein